MRTALVFGGSGQIGTPLLQRLCAEGWQVLALSRQPRADAFGVHWLQGGFEAMPRLPASVDAIVSCGPLDHFARWYVGSDITAPRVVAFGSTSVETKRASADAGERDLVRRLHAGEQAVFAAAAARGAAATLLRPTLVYGRGGDASLSRIAALASRHRFFPLPRGATGLRQPVHVDDLAGAAIACLDSHASHGHAYALPGGETLPYREMVERVLACLPTSARLVELPRPLFALAVRVVQRTGRAQGFGDAAMTRMRADLVFDPAPAAQAFGYAPRPFRPEARMFIPSAP